MRKHTAVVLENLTPYVAELSLAPYGTNGADYTTTDSAIDVERGFIVCELASEEGTAEYTINRVFMDGSVTYTAAVYSLYDENADPVTGYTTTSTQIVLPAIGVGQEFDLILDATPNPSVVGGQTKPIRRGTTTLGTRPPTAPDA